MEFDEQEDTVDEMEEEIPVVQGNYENSARVKMTISAAAGGGGGGGEMGSSSSRKSIRYRDCLKNHAVGHGGHAVDGCGEFMAAGEEGTLESLKCAACNCHRNFHRKEIEGESSFHNQNTSPFSQYYRSPPSAAGYLHAAPTPFSHYHHHQQQRPLALPSASGGGRGNSEDMSNPSSSGGGGGYSGGGGSSKKRFRTKFTAEQKEKMHEFAERLGWRIQKHDEEAVQQFCQELGIKRHVLKVWMHNNKHALNKKP